MSQYFPVYETGFSDSKSCTIISIDSCNLSLNSDGGILNSLTSGGRPHGPNPIMALPLES